jgi:prepilin-type N-terminal cleavage/methylation domain-containing protein
MKLNFLKNKNKVYPAKLWRSRGFTLVEMMVAIAVFSIVMVTAMSALLNVIDANNKARAIKTAINNVSFALEGISKDMRVGTNFACGNDSEEPLGDCTDGGTIISYKSPRAFLGGKAYYKFERTAIYECLQKEEGDICDEDDFNPITSSEVEITSAVFYVLGTNPVDNKQPRMIITLSGKAGTKEKIATTFDLQTSVSQRTRVQNTTP